MRCSRSAPIEFCFPRIGRSRTSIMPRNGSTAPPSAKEIGKRSEEKTRCGCSSLPTGVRCNRARLRKPQNSRHKSQSTSGRVVMADPGDQFVDVQGVKTRFWKVGNEGSPIVLLAGIGCSVLEWRNNIDVLAASHRVYALDMLGD